MDETQASEKNTRKQQHAHDDIVDNLANIFNIKI
jgi:hypothetical protein